MRFTNISKLFKTKTYLLICSLILLFTLGFSGSAGANSFLVPLETESVPPVINYQGVVKTDGNLYHGFGYFKFAIIDSPSGNGAITYWANWNPTANGTEPPVAVPLEVNQGLFNIRLGETIPSAMNWPINSSVFTTEQTYLRVWFSQTGASGSFEALEPNQRFTSVAYAMHADTVNGFHASSSPASNTLIALDSSAYLRIPRLLDSNNTGYYIDPASTSILNNVSGMHFSVNFEETNTGYTVGDSTSNDIDYGLRVRDPDENGIWISGAGDAGINISSAFGDGLHLGTVGEYGLNIYESTYSGVYIQNTPATGFYADNVGWGTYINNATYYGTYSRGRTAGGFFADIDSGAYTYVAYGDNGILSNKTKNFVEQHPTDPSKVIIYASLEGGEAGTYYRGTAQLHAGTAIIKIPAHYSLVTEDEGLTVQVTPRQDCNGLFVAEATTSQVIVKELQSGHSNAKFDFMINGIRTGYLDYQVIREASDITPMEDNTREQAKFGQ